MVFIYDKVFQMFVKVVIDVVCWVMEKGIYFLVVVNYVNFDMVGYIGKFKEVIQAIEIVDFNLGCFLVSVVKVGGIVLIIVDYGNVEYMSDEFGNFWIVYIINLVLFILVEGEGCKIFGYGGEVKLWEGGKLVDIVLIILDILQLFVLVEMIGKILIDQLLVEIKVNCILVNFFCQVGGWKSVKIKSLYDC